MNPDTMYIILCTSVDFKLSNAYESINFIGNVKGIMAGTETETETGTEIEIEAKIERGTEARIEIVVEITKEGKKHIQSHRECDCNYYWSSDGALTQCDTIITQ